MNIICYISVCFVFLGVAFASAAASDAKQRQAAKKESDEAPYERHFRSIKA